MLLLNTFINIFNYLLECINRRFELDWLRDVSYTLCGERNKSEQQIQSVQFKLPQQLSNEIVQFMKLKYKPERTATARYLSSLKQQRRKNLNEN